MSDTDAVLMPTAAEFDEMKFDEATATIRKWVNHGTVTAPRLVAELRYWLKNLGG